MAQPAAYVQSVDRMAVAAELPPDLVGSIEPSDANLSIA